MDPDEDAALLRAKENLAFYFTTPSYAPVVEGGPWESAVARIRERFRAETALTWTDLAAEVPDAMVADFCLVGTPDSIGARAAAFERELEGRGIGETVFQVAGLGRSGEEYADTCIALISALSGRDGGAS